MKFSSLFITCFFGAAQLSAQSPAKIHTEDVCNFWIAYDSVQSTQIKEKQVQFLQTLYVDKASQGLKDFIAARGFNAEEWLKDINVAPKFWKSVRTKTLAVIDQRDEINNLMLRFGQLYPAFRQPEIYFAVGCLRTAGTTSPGRILIGIEMAAPDSTVDASELSDWHRGRFRDNSGIIPLLAHEAVHTQQKAESDTLFLLGKCLREGASDFIAKLLFEGRVYSTPYLTYGKGNEKTIFLKFKEDMYQTDSNKWLYNGSNAPKGQADLGYFVGFAICQYYYDNAPNKAEAVAKILTIDYQDNNAVNLFYEKTKYADKMN